MELMNGSCNITTYNPKIIEFPKHFILNTQLYDKQTLKPLPLKFYINNPNEANNGISMVGTLQTSINKTNHYAGGVALTVLNSEHNSQNIIQDKNDPNIFYCLETCFYMDSNSTKYEKSRLLKMQYNENTKTYTQLNSFHSDSSGAEYIDFGVIKILCETDDYFILHIYNKRNRGSAVEYYYSCVSLLNKKTFAYTRIINNASMSNFLLSVENDIVYILTTSNAYTRRIIKINTSTKSYATIWTETTTTTIGIHCNAIKIGNYYYILAANLDNSLYAYKIMKMSLDTATDTVNTELIDINLNGFVLDNSTNQNLEYNYYIIYTLRTIQTENNTYLSLLMHTSPKIGTDYNYQCKHALLKMNNDSFDVVDLTQLKDGCYGSLENGDSKHQVWYIQNCVMFYAFDETKEKMICTYRKPGIFVQIGFDSLNRFITQTKDNVVEILTDTNACTLVADFAEELYDKDNASEVDTTVSFYAKNFSDEYLETSVKLTLIGPVVFKENNSKELIISSLKTGIRTVPVTITGYGNIQIIITQNT